MNIIFRTLLGLATVAIVALLLANLLELRKIRTEGLWIHGPNLAQHQLMLDMLKKGQLDPKRRLLPVKVEGEVDVGSVRDTVDVDVR
ncbi:MAG: hypothetical protein HY666_05080 [Chloroflexi bacterium]|nr:hypothetical protein [Chloroflexota bacterium]